jgi:hypothetical protein
MRQFDKKDLWPLLKDVGAWHEAYGDPGANRLFAATVRHLRRLDGDRRNRADDQTSTWKVENQTIAKLIGAMDNGGKIVARSTGENSTAGLDPSKIVVVRDDYEPTKSKFGGEFRAYVFDGKYTDGGGVKYVNLTIAADVKAALDALHAKGHTRAVITYGHRTYELQNSFYTAYINYQRWKRGDWPKGVPEPPAAGIAAAPTVGRHRTAEAVDINLVWRAGDKNLSDFYRNFDTMKPIMNKYNLRCAYDARDGKSCLDIVHWSRDGR